MVILETVGTGIMRDSWTQVPRKPNGRNISAEMNGNNYET